MQFIRRQWNFWISVFFDFGKENYQMKLAMNKTMAKIQSKHFIFFCTWDRSISTIVFLVLQPRKKSLNSIKTRWRVDELSWRKWFYWSAKSTNQNNFPLKIDSYQPNVELEWNFLFKCLMLLYDHYFFCHFWVNMEMSTQLDSIE